MNQSLRLMAVNDEILAHRPCGFDICDQATNLVVGEGPDDAEVIIIGEAPGEKEDAEGRPFVGAAGKFLDVMLDVAGLDRDGVFITNIVKARPPNNRDPKIDEVRHYRPWLIAQITAIMPRVIVPLGRHAFSHFDDRPISAMHGKLIAYGVGSIFPMYHPAAVLHNPDLRDTMLEDAKSLGRELR